MENNKIRQIIIETDGDTVRVAKAEVTGLIELSGILDLVIKNMKMLSKKEETEEVKQN